MNQEARMRKTEILLVGLPDVKVAEPEVYGSFSGVRNGFIVMRS